MSRTQGTGWHARLVRYALAQTEWEDIILRLAEPAPGAHLLSVGCSAGEFTMRVADRIGTADVSAVEIAEQYVQQASQRGIRVTAADLNQTLPYDDDAFDVILSNHDIEHLWNTDQFLRECHRVLRRGGYMVLSTPNLAAFHNLVFLLLGKQPLMADVSDEVVVGNWGTPTRRENPDEPAHRRLFTAAALKQLLRWHAFTVEHMIRSGFRPFPGRLARILACLFPLYSTTITVKARKA
jgi:ubiquinone/menaquinone biosynthesis C-methylase UbiE